MTEAEIVIAESQYPIQPQDIDASRHFSDAFDHMETEISAGWVIRFLQERGLGWEPFTREQIEAFYSKKHQDGFLFNRLVEPEMVPPSLARGFSGHFDARVPVGGGWIVLEDGKYCVTNDFIMRCHKSSPAGVTVAN